MITHYLGELRQLQAAHFTSDIAKSIIVIKMHMRVYVFQEVF